jgi:ATP-binding cassette, subfamily B, bacterial
VHNAVHFLILSGFTSISSLLGLVLPFAPKIILDNGIMGNNMPLVYDVLWFTFITSTASLVINWFVGIYENYLLSYTSYKTRIGFVSRLFRLDEEVSSIHRTGDLISRSGGLQSGIKYVLSTIRDLISLSIRILVIPYILIHMDWKLFVIGLPVFVGINLGWYYVQRIVRVFQKSYAEASGQRDASLYDIVSSVIDIRMSGQHKRIIQRYRREYVKVWNIYVVMQIYSSLFQQLEALILAILTLFLNFYGWSMVGAGIWTIGKMATITIALGYLSAPLQKLLQMYNQLVSISVSVERYFDIYNKKSYNDNGKDFREKCNSIKLIDVSYSYPNSKCIIDNVSVEFSSNYLYGITGDSGSGKSTLIKIISSILRPSIGSILYNNTPSEDINKSSIHKMTRLLSNSQYYYYGTLLDNLTFSNSHDSNEIKEIINILHLNSLCKSHKNTKIGESGIKLSTGEKQRIALARVILDTKSSVFLLDEPFSHIDKSTIVTILPILKNHLKNNISILITHNPNILMNCDIIYNLYKGSLYQMNMESLYVQ